MVATGVGTGEREPAVVPQREWLPSVAARYFGLEELVTPMHCRLDPTYFKCHNGTGRFLCVLARAIPSAFDRYCLGLPGSSVESRSKN